MVLHHVSAPARRGADQALIAEPVNGLADGDGRQSELLLQGPLAGQPAGDLPRGDPGAQDGRELDPWRIGRVPVDHGRTLSIQAEQLLAAVRYSAL